MHVSSNLTSVFEVWSAEGAKLIPSNWLRPFNNDTFGLQHTTEFFHFLGSFLHNVFIVRFPGIFSYPLPAGWTCFRLVNTNTITVIIYIILQRI